MSDQTKVNQAASAQPTDGQSAWTNGAGKHSLDEILSQPQCWEACLKDLRENGNLSAISEKLKNVGSWLFIGCGSSYYVALAAAATMSGLTGKRAQAIPASELLLFPEATLAAAGGSMPVLISRSGRTSEVIRAGELLKTQNIPTLAITCTSGQPLEKIATATISLPQADEKSTVMTRSFSSMLLALQVLAGTMAGDSEFCSSLLKIPPVAARVLQTLPSKISDFASTHAFSDYVCLGQGPFYGLACEYALKITEMSLSYAQVFHTLEFRHGPMSIVGKETLLIFLLSEAGYQSECAVLEEMKTMGGTTFVVSNRADSRARAAADVLVETSLDVPELARLAPFLMAGQLLGLYTGLHKQLDPDSPRHLSRVVNLNREHSSAHSEKIS